MTTIISKRHPLKFYFLVTFGTLFLIGLGTLILLTGSEILKKEQPATKEVFYAFI